MRLKLFIILGFLPFLINGQELTFRHVTIADGLNNGTINSIAQDSLGRLWLATWDGLMQYDGYRVLNHKPILGDENSLPSKRVANLSIDSRNNLWISTIKGLCRYDPANEQFDRFTVAGLPPRAVRSKVVEYKGDLLIRSYGNIYYLPSDQVDTREFRSMKLVGAEDEIADREIHFVFASDERLLLGFRERDQYGSLFTLMYNGRIMDSIIRIEDRLAFRVPGIVRDMEIKDEMAYLASDAGFSMFDFTTEEISRNLQLDGFRINALLLGSDGKIWLATADRGLISLEPESGQVEQFGHDPNRINTLLGNQVFSLLEDFSGNLLLGHGGEGITMVNLKDKQFSTYRYDPQNPMTIGDNTVLCFAERGEKMLIGTRNKGLFIMETSQQDGQAVFKELSFPGSFVPAEEPMVVWWIEKESPNLFWVGTGFGLIRAEVINGRWHFENFFKESNIRSIFIDEHKNLWLGTYNGLYIVPAHKRATMEATLFRMHSSSTSLSDKVITSFLLDSRDQFWIGTENGGINRLMGSYSAIDFSLDLTEQVQFRVYSASMEPGKLNNEEISVLYEHSDQSIWVGTKGGGINILNPEQDVFSTLTHNDGLPGNNVYGILPDKQGKLWFSTNKGLSCYDPYARLFKNYTPSDGIQGDVFMANAYFNSPDGRMYFGGRNGFTSFFPERIINNEVEAKLHFSGIEIEGESVGIGDTLHNKVVLPEALPGLTSVSLSYRERSFDVLFSAIHFQFPADNKVEYFLEGFSDRPSLMDASVGRITFNNLKHGQYKLRMRSGNSDQVWSENNAILEINILPPWYKTMVAVVLFALLGIAIVSGLIFLLLHRQSLSHELKIEKIEKSNMRDLNESKLRFFTNVSHEFRTPLSLTVGPIDNLIRECDAGDFRVRKQLEMASRNAKLLLRLIDQIIDFRRLEAGKIKLKSMEMEMKPFIQSIVDNFESLQKEKNVGVYVNYPDDSVKLWFDPQKIEQVLYNLLSNAFKHVPQEGSIAVTLSRTNHAPGRQEAGSWAQISVYNDGKTIPEDELQKVFERFYKVDDLQLGSGIGLAYARSLVDLHSGVINVENRQQDGVAFNVYLPRGNKHLDSEEMAVDSGAYIFSSLADASSPKTAPVVTNPGESKGLSLLVVEDNDELRDFFRTILGSRYEFHEAANGQLGYEIAKELVPDIIISDLLMPEMDGFELCDRLKNSEKTSHIPIILLTAKNTPEDKITGFKSGADAYVVKPFEIDVLEAQIIRLIENRKRLQEQFVINGEITHTAKSEFSKEDHFISRVRKLIEENIEDPELNVNKLSEKINLSSTQLYRKIKAITGQSSVDFIKDFRLIKSAALLKATDHSVKEVCFKTGFKSPSYFVKCFKIKYGLTPREFASNGK